MRSTNYIKLLIPCPDQTMYVERMWFLNYRNVEAKVADAEFALADAQKRYSGTSWKLRPRLVAWQAIMGFPQIDEVVGHAK